MIVSRDINNQRILQSDWMRLHLGYNLKFCVLNWGENSSISLETNLFYILKHFECGYLPQVNQRHWVAKQVWDGWANLVTKRSSQMLSFPDEYLFMQKI